ncbi:hypothetical protein Maq22A_c28505 [Methylobacterium aquaticum]|uniref:Uncharacterized protein n=1 Tax=Methylobacterium aquaticum TaxID=270351 RepID=A0A1Y0ZCG7_9HYPH|nr:hypothetical protein Maq22A_c28505 [Methylobacterium aquaticum]
MDRRRPGRQPLRHRRGDTAHAAAQRAREPQALPRRHHRARPHPLDQRPLAAGARGLRGGARRPARPPAGRRGDREAQPGRALPAVPHLPEPAPGGDGRGTRGHRSGGAARRRLRRCRRADRRPARPRGRAVGGTLRLARRQHGAAGAPDGRDLPVLDRAARHPREHHPHHPGAPGPVAAPARRGRGRAARRRFAGLDGLARSGARPPPRRPARPRRPVRGGARDARHLPARGRDARQPRPRGLRRLRAVDDPFGARHPGRLPAGEDRGRLPRRSRNRGLPVADRAPVRDDRRPAGGPRDHAGAPQGAGGAPLGPPAGRGAGGDDRLLGFEQGRRLRRLELGARQGPGQADPGRRAGRSRHRVLPRPRRLGQPRRRSHRTGHRGPAAGLDPGPVPHHRAGRGGLVQVRQPRHRRLPDGAARLGGARPRPRRRPAAGPGRGDRRVRRRAGGLLGRLAGGLCPADHASRPRDVFRRREPARRDRAPQHRLAAGPALRRPQPRRPAGDPVGVRLEPEPARHHRLVRGRQRLEEPARRARGGRPGAAAADVRGVAALPADPRRGGKDPAHRRSRHRPRVRHALPGRGRPRGDLRDDRGGVPADLRDGAGGERRGRPRRALPALSRPARRAAAGTQPGRPRAGRPPAPLPGRGRREPARDAEIGAAAVDQLRRRGIRGDGVRSSRSISDPSETSSIGDVMARASPSPLCGGAGNPRLSVPPAPTRTPPGLRPPPSATLRPSPTERQDLSQEEPQ